MKKKVNFSKKQNLHKIDILLQKMFDEVTTKFDFLQITDAMALIKKFPVIIINE